jgi:hypothetical protein
MHPQEAIAWAFFRTRTQVSTHHRIVAERPSRVGGLPGLAMLNRPRQRLAYQNVQFTRRFWAAVDTKRSVRVESF